MCWPEALCAATPLSQNTKKRFQHVESSQQHDLFSCIPYHKLSILNNPSIASNRLVPALSSIFLPNPEKRHFESGHRLSLHLCGSGNLYGAGFYGYWFYISIKIRDM